MNWKGVASISLGLCCGFAFAQGPVAPLYVTADGGSDLLIVQGLSETFRPTAFGDEGPIAVYGSIATTGIQTGGFGGNYNLSGNYTGGFYASMLTNDASDGTTDGTHNYEIDSSGYVYQTSLTYQSPSQLFWAGSSATGITYDPDNNSLWVDVGGYMTDFTTQGATLGGFQTSLTQYTALALSPNGLTLWAGTDSGGGSFLTAFGINSGNVVGFDSLGSVTIEGMEFNESRAITPEPQSFLPCALGVLLFARRRRSSRSLSSLLQFLRNGG